MNKNLKRYSSLGLSLIFVMSSFNGVFAEGNNINKPLSETERIVRSQKEMNFKKSKILEEFEKDETCLKVKREKVVYFVEFDGKANKDQVIQSLKEIKDVKVLYEYNILFKAVSVEAYPEVLDKLKSIKGVKDVERAGKLAPLMENARKLVGVDKASDYLKSLNAINANLGKNYDGRGMIIANIDTGMDASHKAMRIDEDAKGSLKLKKNDLKGSDKEFWLSDKVPHSFNYLNGGKITTEKYDDGSDYHDPHGMHIAGILAANDKDEDIKAHKGIRGIAPNAQLFSYKMYSDASDGFAGDETMFHAFEDCIKHDVDVISVSSGFTGTGLAGEKYWQAIRSLRKAGIPICVATGNYATSSSSSSWDRYANNALKMTDTGNVTRTAAHEDAIAVASSRNTKIEYEGVNIGGKDFRYSQIGAFFDKGTFKQDKYKFIYLGQCQDEDIAGKDLKDKIVVMDRIYTKDLKYSFKKVFDKGARGVVVVNTVSYYNRDDWENIPAMGYEEDENTRVPVFSVSGMDGKLIWDMICGRTPDEKEDFKAKNSDYRIDMEKYNSKKPKVGEEKELSIKFLDHKIAWEDTNVPAGSTSWGPRIDLMLKPDVSAPGKNIYSTLNKINGVDTYQYMSGTSMATPVVSASTVLIRPRVKELVKEPVIKARGIDITSLTKIMLQNTSRPMIDPTTDDGKGNYLFASPRQQGSGLINVERALKNNLIVSYKVEDSLGEMNSYGAVSLKEIKSDKKDFTINIDNPSDRDITVKVSSSKVTTDGEVNKKKLDEQYKDEKSKDGIQNIAEIHPTEVKGASISFAQDEITIPARGSFNLGATLNVGEAKDKDKFVEAFINFESKEEKENVKDPQPSLSMPVMGFAGDWNKEPIVDKWAWEEGSRSKGIVGYDDEGNPKIPGTLNKGRGGEHGIDLFKPAGVIQNRETENKTLDQDPELFAFNNSQDFTMSSTGDSKIISKNEIDRGLTPSPLILRSASDCKISIVNTNDEKKNQKDLKVITVDHFIKGILNSKRSDAKGIKSSKLKVYGDLRWDGLIYNPHAEDKTDPNYVEGKFDPIAEGQYYYKFQYRLSPKYPYQVSYIPVKIDRTPPQIISLNAENPDEMILKVKDTYHVQNDHSKTLFQRDQEKTPAEFNEVNNKVWFAGAAFVDEYGEIQENLKVVNTGKVDKYGSFEIDEEGNSVYKILGANKNLPGKTLEVAALDGASNFTKLYRVKFDKEVKDGKLAYYLEDDENTKLGEIDASKLNNVDIKDEKTDKNENKLEKNNRENISEKPLVGLEDNSYLKPLSEEDTKRIIKPKETVTTNEFTGDTSTDYDYGDINSVDEYGIPSKYSNGDPMEFKDKDLAALKAMGYVGKIVPDERGGFDLSGYVKNVSPDAKIYFRSTRMAKTTDKREELKKVPGSYDVKTHSFKFNLWGNKDDVDNNKGIDYKGDIELYVVDGNERSESIFLRMPKEINDSVEKKQKAKLLTSQKSIIELGKAELGGELKEKKDENGKTYYEVKDELKISKGYGVRIISRNPGKTGLDANYRKDFINNDEDVMPIDANIKGLDGFNVVRYEIYKLDDSGKLKEDNLVEEMGKCLYIDRDGVQLDMDQDTFNPYSDGEKGELYVRKSPHTLRGRIGDKGGFNWHLRINESMVDQYLIYGDLKSDNSKDFEVTFDVRDNDVMDWSAKDYKLNGPQKGILSQYRIYLDSVKPEIKLSKDEISGNDILLKAKDKTYYLNISDKRDGDKAGRVESSKIYVNDKDFDSTKNLEAYAIDGKVEVKVSASDYAKNTSVKIYSIDLNSDEIKEEKNKDIKVKINGKDQLVKEGEDFVLPEYSGNVEANKKFVGWNVRGVTQKPGHIFLTKEDIEIEPVFEEVIQTTHRVEFENNGGSGRIEGINVGDKKEIILPENTFTSPEGKVFDGWIVSGNKDKKKPGDKIEVASGITITASWKDMDKEISHENNKPSDETRPQDNNKPSDETRPQDNNKPSDSSSESGNNWNTGIFRRRSHENTSKVVTGSNDKNKSRSIFSSYNSYPKDIENHWAKKAIISAVEKNYFKDIADLDNFMPEKSLTRAEFVTILGRLANVDASKYKDKVFNDIDGSKYYSPYIDWAYKNKIASGFGDGKFMPDKELSREEMCAFLSRFNKVHKINNKEENINISFKDEKNISNWSKESVKEMVRLGLIKGMDDGKFMPKEKLTRAQIAQVVFGIK
ncbi:MAG: S8 family serine peptidase [Peptoniphilus sp.]|uniref:S8 family serine peptidase n=1 Tax=Peptoniphilus sp. TaxID=1971214 RepID=UPI0039A023B2